MCEILILILFGLCSGIPSVLYADEEAPAAQADAALAGQADQAGQPGQADQAESADPAEAGAEQKPLSEREKAEAEAFGDNQVTDIHLKTVETLELTPEQSKAAHEISEKYVQAFCETIQNRARFKFLKQENAFMNEAVGEHGAYTSFLKQLGAMKEADLEKYNPEITKIMEDGTAPAVETLKDIQDGLVNEAHKSIETWQDLHQTLVEREYLQFELKSNRHIVTQIASMFSMDKRWFWLLGVFAFGVLVAVAWHDRRHEIRRWLNGGRARQMKLAQILMVCFTGLVILTLVSFFMGETIYRAMLDLTFRTTAPHAVYTNLTNDLEKESKDLQVRIQKEEKDLKAAHGKWQQMAVKKISDSSKFVGAWQTWRSSVEEIVVQSLLLQEINGKINEDNEKLLQIDRAMAALSGDTLFFLRIKHLVRFLLGSMLAILTFLGIACFWSEVHARLRRTQNTCPHCLSENTLEPCDENGLQMPSNNYKSKNLICTKVVQENPYEICGYSFPRALAPLTKLSFPTLGIPQVGKTHWLTMLYWEIANRYYPKLGFSCVPSSVTEEMDRRVDEIMLHRIGTAATQRDSIPLPLVLRYKDKDPLGRTEILADIFDYSGEITTDAPSDDYRRERALKSEGFLFFMDPTYPWHPQAEALKRFRKDLKSIKGLRKNESLHLPIAVCLTKIDLLPLVKSLGAEAEREAIRFYEALGKIDPTGI
ncbi:MAG: hypothetical protein K6C40_01330, partial [Thermoguttaceae bacterium]|nr:hypothetical protein [Thermoguttaceae bacterium]